MKIRPDSSVCEKHGLKPNAPEPGSKVGIALSTLGHNPINGLRHPPGPDTNGWYLWCGERLGEEDDFFQPLHLEHLAEYLPQVIEFLDLPPGYRFLLDPGNQEEVWFDEKLLRG